MALKALMLRKKLDTKNNELRENEAAFKDLEKREAELEKSIEEAETDEERSVVEEAVSEFERDKGTLEEAKKSLEDAIAAIEKELEDLEEDEPEEEPAPEPTPEEEKSERKVRMNMEIRSLEEMNMQERDAFFAREDVKAFLGTVRTAISEKRAIGNAGLLIPEQMLPMIRRAIEKSSKLISKVNKVTLKGTGRAVVQGAISEGVWTEMCGKLNELSITFNDVEIDGYKVGGFFAVCNAQIEDDDYNLTQILTDAIGKAIGKALDKAIVYGTGTKMPLGIVTRIAQESEPENYSATERDWEDLHTTHVANAATSVKGIALFQDIVLKSGLTANDYTDDGMIWIMNEKTKTTLMAEAMSVNASGAIVSGMNNTMPVIGGEIIELSFIPDNNIVFGHGQAYMLGERKGIQLASSEHYKFIEDQTVFKGTARYDGKPAIAEAFAVYGIKGTTPTTSGISFAADSAN